MADSGRRSSRREEIPQRVEDAARMMQSSTGPRRGYIPGEMNQTAPYQAGWNQPQDPRYVSPHQNMYNTQSQLTGAQRGFRVQPEPSREPEKKHGKTVAVIAALMVFAALGAGGCFGLKAYTHNRTIEEKTVPYDSLFCPGVYVDGINLGGMTPDQAMYSVQSQIQQRHDAWNVKLVYDGNTVAEINSDMLGFNVDPAHVMNEAWKQGHTGDREQRYEQMLLLEQNPYVVYTATPDGNTGVIDEKLNQIKSMIDLPATDAVMTGFDPSLEYPFQFTEEAYGRQLDIEPVKQKLYQMVSTLESGTVELQPARLEPSVRRADLMKHYMLRSSVYTPIDKHSTENRNMNIQRAFDFVNGYILNPGKTFSFNGVVGERTEARGFYPAIEYVYGEHVEGFGGGVCQASTTIYQAAVCAGLQILKREPHSDSVTYAEYGKDATVYWVGKRKIDLTFKNTTDEPIYITAAVQKDPMNRKRLIAKVSMYGQDMGDVRYELAAEISETLPAPFEPVYVKDTNATYVTYRDQQESVSKAREGYVVKSYRLRYDGGELTERKALFTDRYEPKPERIYVGVKER